MAVGISELENQRFLLRPSGVGEGQERRCQDWICYSRQRYAGPESEDESNKSIYGRGR